MRLRSEGRSAQDLPSGVRASHGCDEARSFSDLASSSTVLCLAWDRWLQHIVLGLVIHIKISFEQHLSNSFHAPIPSCRMGILTHHRVRRPFISADVISAILHVPCRLGSGLSGALSPHEPMAPLEYLPSV